MQATARSRSSVNTWNLYRLLDALVMGNYIAEADINQDGVVDLLDVAMFVELLGADSLHKVGKNHVCRKAAMVVACPSLRWKYHLIKMFLKLTNWKFSIGQKTVGNEYNAKVRKSESQFKQFLTSAAKPRLQPPVEGRCCRICG